MRILNIIILNSGILDKVISFQIPKDATVIQEQIIIADAHERFKSIILEYGAEPDELDNHIDDGYFSNMAGDDVYITWSDEIA